MHQLHLAPSSVQSLPHDVPPASTATLAMDPQYMISSTSAPTPSSGAASGAHMGRRGPSTTRAEDQYGTQVTFVSAHVQGHPNPVTTTPEGHLEVEGNAMETDTVRTVQEVRFQDDSPQSQQQTDVSMSSSVGLQGKPQRACKGKRYKELVAESSTKSALRRDKRTVNYKLSSDGLVEDKTGSASGPDGKTPSSIAQQQRKLVRHYGSNLLSL